MDVLATSAVSRRVVRRAWGEPPPVAVLVLAYFVGMLGNLLPLPGGVGGVEGGMIGALIAFGVGGGLAVVAVLVYRVFAFWLPMLPGAFAYLQLRRGFAARPPPAVAERGYQPPPPTEGQARARPRRAATAALAVRRWFTRGRLAWLGAVAVVGGAYLAGAFPKLPGAEEAVRALGGELGPWTYAVVGGLALLETAALVGLLAPGEWSVIIGGAVAAEGAVGVVGLLVAVWVCAAAGHGLSFIAGRRFGRAFLVRHGPRFRLGPERLSRVDRFFARHGAKAVLGGQFIGLVRAVVPFLAGASGMSYRRFAAPSLVATGTWAAAFTLLGYFSYRSLAEVEGAVGVAAGAGTVLAALAAGAAWIRHRRRRRRGAPEGWPAVARYVAGAHDPAVAEVAVTVDDRRQGRGLGTSLSRLLLERAAAEGLDRLHATVGGDNARALALARRSGYEVSSVASGSVELERRRSGRVPPAGRAWWRSVRMLLDTVSSAKGESPG